MGIKDPSLGRLRPNTAISFLLQQKEAMQFNVAVDWGDFRKKKLVAYDGEKYETLTRPLDECIPVFAKCGVRSIVAENSFGSFDLRERNRILDAAKQCNVYFGVIPPKQTEKYRRRQGIEEKSEKIDAKCIFEIANTAVNVRGERCHVSAAKYASEEQLARQDARNSTVEGRALVLRSLGWPEEESQEFTKYLPEDVPEWVKKTYFYDGKGKTSRDATRGLKHCWCLPIVAAALQVLADRGSRKEFDRKLGISAFGHPSFQRSNFHFHIVARSVKDELGVKNVSQLQALNQDDVTVVRKQQLTLHRKFTRWLFHQVKAKQAMGTSGPSLGTSRPEAARKSRLKSSHR